MFNIQLPIPTVNQSWGNLCSSVNMLDWFERNNRPYQMDFFKKLNNALINEIIEDRKLINNGDFSAISEKYFNRFESELYDEQAYKDTVQEVEESIPIIQKCSSRFKNLNQSWGFKIFDEYTILVDIYSVGGQYNANTGTIHLRAPKNSLMPITAADTAGLITHEMLHLGIEEMIVQRFKLQQEEKERVVDNLCIYVMDGIMDRKRRWQDGTVSWYQEVAKHCAYMDKCIGTQPETNLVQSVDEFLQKFPKEKRYKVSD